MIDLSAGSCVTHVTSRNNLIIPDRLLNSGYKIFCSSFEFIRQNLIRLWTVRQTAHSDRERGSVLREVPFKTWTSSSSDTDFPSNEIYRFSINIQSFHIQTLWIWRDAVNFRIVPDLYSFKVWNSNDFKVIGFWITLLDKWKFSRERDLGGIGNSISKLMREATKLVLPVTSNRNKLLTSVLWQKRSS